MDKVVVSREDLDRKQKELKALLIDLEALESLLKPQTGEAASLLKRAQSLLQEERQNDLDELKRRIEENALSLTQGASLIGNLKERARILSNQTEKEKEVANRKGLQEKLAKLLQELEGDFKGLDKLDKKGRDYEIQDIPALVAALQTIDPSSAEEVGALKRRVGDLEPRIIKWRAEIDKQKEKQKLIGDYLNKLQGQAEKERDKEAQEQKNKALGDATIFTKEFDKKQKILNLAIAGQRRLLEAMTNNPDYLSEQARIQQEKDKLEELEHRLEELVIENEELNDQIGPMLRGEIMCNPNELMHKIAVMREKMDEDHNEINDFDEELTAMRKREKDANVPVILAEREKQRTQLKMELQKMRDKKRALQDKLKHQEQYGDMPGDLDDLIRQQVKDDLKRVDEMISKAESGLLSAEDSLDGLHDAVKGKNLKAVTAEELALYVEQLAALRVALAVSEKSLLDVDIALNRSNEKLAGLDLDKLVFDKENDLGLMERRIILMREDWVYFRDLGEVLENAPRTQDDTSLLRDIIENLEPIRQALDLIEKERARLKEKMGAIHRLKEDAAKKHHDPKKIAEIFKRTGEV